MEISRPVSHLSFILAFFLGEGEGDTEKTMLGTTKAALAAILKSDGTATQEERDAIAAIIDGDGVTAMPRLLTRKQVAELINRTPRMVDYFGKMGFIRRITLGKNGRASGYDAESVRLFRAGRATSTSETAKEA